MSKLPIDKIVAIYSETGSSSLSRGDLEMLQQLAEESRPCRILEISPSEGLATLVLASNLSDENGAMLISVKPAATSSNESELLESDNEITISAATQLNLDKRIEWYKEEVSHHGPATTVSSNLDQICQKYGPFQLIFLNWPSSSERVRSDLKLATTFLSPGGIIALNHTLELKHAPDIRRAVFNLLETRSDFVFVQDQNWDNRCNIGALRHFAGSKHYDVNEAYTAEFYERCEEMHQRVIPHLAHAIYEKVNPKSVIALGCGAGMWLSAFSELGVKDLRGVEGSHAATIWSNTKTDSAIVEHDLRKPFCADWRYDLCLCLDVIEHIEPEYEDIVLKSCTDASDTIVFSSPPPGQGGDFHVNERPIAYWAAKFLAYGYVMLDEIRPIFENRPLPDTTYQKNIYMVRKIPALSSFAKDDLSILSSLIKDKERRIEDLFLQNTFRARALESATHRSGEVEDWAFVIKQKECLEIMHWVDFIIPAESIVQEQGLCFKFNFRTYAGRLFSRLPIFCETVLLEDRKPLSAPRAFHDQIRSEGHGHYSMWADGVFFSSSDGSDPRSNGRQYSFSIPAYVHFLENMPERAIMSYQL